MISLIFTLASISIPGAMATWTCTVWGCVQTTTTTTTSQAYQTQTIQQSNPQFGITIDIPARGSYIQSSSVSLSGTLIGTDSSPTVNISLDNANFSLNTASVSGTSWSYSYTGLANGQHAVDVQLHDMNKLIETSTTFTVYSSNSEAVSGGYNITVIEYSEICQKEIANNMTTDCPSVKTLMPWDSSNQGISGLFLEDKSGISKRSTPVNQLSYQFYYGSKAPVVCVLCNVPLALTDIFQEIIIQPKGHQFVELAPIQDATVTYTQPNGLQLQVNDPNTNLVTPLLHNGDRYVSPDCRTVDLVYSKALLNDTIQYLQSGCKKTSYNDVTNMTKVSTTPSDYKDSIYYKEYYWLHSLNVSNQNCLIKTCNIPRDPYSNFDASWEPVIHHKK